MKNIKVNNKSFNNLIHFKESTNNLHGVVIKSVIPVKKISEGLKELYTKKNICKNELIMGRKFILKNTEQYRTIQ